MYEKIKNIVLNTVDGKSSLRKKKNDMYTQCLKHYNFIKYLNLDESLFESIMQISTVTTQIEPYSERKKESAIYFVLNGFV